ncbi:MAG: hypothetical protein IJ022_03875 [Burkholderiaceae bacterium]|nr:hypothetical protein [Burkholderiaceae bacterium]
MSKNFSKYIVLLAVLVLFGFLMGHFKWSLWWAILPGIIGGFSGSYMSDFTQILLDPKVDAAKREQVIKTLRILTMGWTVLAVTFVFMGYSLTAYL